MQLTTQIDLPMDMPPKIYVFRSGSATATCYNIGEKVLSIKFSGMIGDRQLIELRGQISKIIENRKSFICFKAAIISETDKSSGSLPYMFGTIGAMIVLPEQYAYMVERCIVLREFKIFRVVFLAGQESTALAWLDVH
jgi:hypothetical protein